MAWSQIPQTAPRTPAGWRQALVMVIVGLIGLLGLWLQPIPAEVLKALPAMPDLSPWMIKTLLLLNPFMLLLVAAALGAAAASRVGLRSVLAGTAPAYRLGVQLAWASVGGVALGAALGVLDRILLPWLPEVWLHLVRLRLSDSSGLIAGMLYGGLTEEILLRWGLMSAMAWLLMRWLALPARIALPVAIGLCAIVFGAAHLPAVMIQMEPTAALIGRTLLINGLAGAVYGWLYWRYHLEAAMAAHAASHIGLFAMQRLFMG